MKVRRFGVITPHPYLQHRPAASLAMNQGPIFEVPPIFPVMAYGVYYVGIYKDIYTCLLILG